MGKIESFKDLEVWNEARRLSNEVHRVSKDGAFSRDYTLKKQIRRAANSIPLNIAEGYARRSDAEFAQFLNYARGSYAEVETSLSLAYDRGYLSESQFNELSESYITIGRKISSLIKYLREDS